MPLESTLLEIVASGGLAEDVNPRVLQPGSWLALENVAPDKTGAFRKRNGYSALETYVEPDTDYVISYAANSCPLHVGVAGGGPFVLQVSPQDGENGLAGGQSLAPPFIATLNAQQQWVAKDDVPPFVVKREVGLRAHQDFVGWGVAYAGNAKYTVGVLAVLQAGVILPIILRGVDTRNGAVVQDDIVIGYINSSFAFSLGYTVRVMATSSRVVVVYPIPATGTNSGLVITSYNVNTQTFGTATMVASRTGTSLPSICSYPGGGNVFETIVVAYGDGSTLRVREWLIGSETLGSFVTSYALAQPNPIDDVEVCIHREANDLFVSYTLDKGDGLGETRSLCLHESAPYTWALKWGVSVLDAEHRWNFLTNGYASGYLVTVGRDPSGTISVASLIYCSQTALSGTSISTEKLVGALVPVARPFAWAGKLYLPTIARGDGVGGSPFVGAIVHLRVTTPGHVQGSEPAPLVGTFAVGDFGTPNFTTFHGCNFSSHPYGLISFAAPVLNGIDQSAIDVVNVLTPTNTWLTPTTEAQGLVVIPGALTSFFDGQSVFEAGFVEAPVINGIVNTITEAATVLAGNYVYTAVWEYYDALGLLHYSQPSPLVRHTVPPGGAAHVDLTILTDRMGRRARVLDGERRPVRLVVYRTKAGQDGPFYRLMSPTMEKNTGFPRYNDYVVNERYLNEITFEDTTIDAQIDARDYGFFPFDAAGTVAGRLNSDPPPPSTFALNHKNRLWIVSGDKSREVWFSQLMESGFAPMFSNVNRIYLSDTTEEITGLAALADRVLIFTQSRIYAVDGDGPDNRGNGIPFRDPYPFSLEVGCTIPKSLVSTNDGVLFAHAPTNTIGFADTADVAIYMIGADLQVRRISGPIADTLAKRPAIVCAFHMASRGWVVWGTDRAIFEGDTDEAIHLIWSYWTNQWVKWRTDYWRVSSGTVWRGKHLMAVVKDSEAVNQLVGTVYAENGWEDPPGPGGGQWITMKLQTPWIRPGAIQGYGRTRRVQVLAEVDGEDECNLAISLAHDHEEAAWQTATFPIAADSHRGFPIVHAEARVARQKAMAVRVTITDTQKNVESFGSGVTVSAVTLEIAGKTGLAKLSKANKGGASGT